MSLTAKELHDKIKAFQNAYYTQHAKAIMFKNAQKLAIAQAVSAQFDMPSLLEASIFVVEGTYCIYMDYTLVKLYANPTNYAMIAGRIIAFVDQLIATYGKYEVHFNIEGFTVSAAERYVEFVRVYCAECNRIHNPHMDRVNGAANLYTYHTPVVMSNIMNIIMKLADPVLRQRFTYYNKDVSEKLIQSLLNPGKSTA